MDNFNDNNESLRTGCDITELATGTMVNSPVIGEEYYVSFLVEYPGGLRIDTTELTLKYWDNRQKYTTRDKIKIFSSLIKNNMKEKVTKIIILSFMRL